MTTAFLDTGYLIALEASDDQHHKDAQRHWRTYSQQKPRLLTTSFVFDEIVTFFNTRGKHDKAIEVGERLRRSSSVEFLHVDEALFDAGWSYLHRNADKQYSLTDCISFVLMDRHDILEALTFDHHFEQAGFRRLPEAKV